MSKLGRHMLAFDDFQIDVAERVLKRGGELVPLTQKSFEILFLLVERQGGIVTKEEMLEKVWPETFVEESNLAQNIYTLRKALGPRPAGADGESYIATVPRRGYRFAAPVQEIIQEAAPPVLVQVSEAASVAEPELPVAESLVPEVEPRVAEVKAVPPSSWASRHRWLLVTGGGLVLLGLALGVAWLGSRRKPASALTVSPLTTTGNINAAAISPDGQFVAYATTDQPQVGTLWLEQLATANRRVVIPAAEVRYEALAFAPDGGFLYYSAVPKGEQRRSLYRVSVLGGRAQRLAEDIGTGIAFSPDGKQIAFRGSSNERRAALLFLADADGGNQRELAALAYPEGFQDPAWSPDGQSLVCGAGDTNGPRAMYVVSVRVSDGAITRLTARTWQFVGQTAWLAGGRGVLLVGRDTFAEPQQIWRLDLGDGSARQLTSDSERYNRLSYAARTGTLAALHTDRLTSVWRVPAADPARARQITAGVGGYRGTLAWAPDGKLVYESEAGVAPGLSEMASDGSGARLLSNELTRQSYVGEPALSPDGRYVVFVSDTQGKRHLWRMTRDGGNLLQLTNGTGEENPACSPDGRWVYFTRLETPASSPAIGRVPLAGGAATQVTADYTTYPAIAPDGRTFACLYSPALNMQGQLALYPLEGGKPLRVFPQVVQAQFVRWTPDGRALTYYENPIGAPAKVWLQPVAGGAPQLFTEFAADRLFGLAWSPEGKELACVRGLWATNVMLLRGID